MPQLHKGGKFFFGKSMIHEDGAVQIPKQAIEEYHMVDEGKVYLFTGSKSTGGFCVTRKGLLLPSKLGHILEEISQLLNYTAQPGEFMKYKGRYYCWIDITEDGKLYLTKEMMEFLNIKPAMQLLCIRSSDIAFTMGAKGPLVENAKDYEGTIPEY